jgi:DNA-binding MarR family transcriptional regulator
VAVPKKLDGVEYDTLKGMLAAIEAFRAIRPTMPLQYVVAFLLVAMEEGLGIGDYAKRAGVSMSVMSRHILDIGDRNRHMEEGFGLVTSKQSPMELRKNEVYLTPKGRTLMHQIVRQLNKR